jgi:hypothetical protein
MVYREILLQPVIDDPKRVKTYDFAVPAIDQRYCAFRLMGLGLPHGWRESDFLRGQKAKKYEPGYTVFLDRRLGEDTDYKLTVDEGTGVVAELELTRGGKSSRVKLCTDNVHSGCYEGEDMDPGLAVFYLEFVARTLSLVTDQAAHYPYILNGGYGKCGSVDLAVPKRFLDGKKPKTNEYFQGQFDREACNIAGRFSVTTRPLGFREDGILGAITLNEGEKDCNYRLDSSGHYNPHNVDCFWEAAALHGIAAAFINQLLNRE